MEHGGDVGRVRLFHQGLVARICRPSGEVLCRFEQAVGVVHVPEWLATAVCWRLLQGTVSIG